MKSLKEADIFNIQNFESINRINIPNNGFSSIVANNGPPATFTSARVPPLWWIGLNPNEMAGRDKSSDSDAVDSFMVVSRKKIIM